MLILRIRQAEVAANAGRLDEAFEVVARDGRFKSNRRGQEAITKLVAALVGRGREHLTAGRMTQAAADCEKAGRLGGGDLPDVAQLAADLRGAQQQRQRGHHDAAVAVATARRHLEDGALSVGRQVLAAVADDDSRARRLMTDIDEHKDRYQAALAAARAAVERADWPAAAQAIGRARSIRPGGDEALLDVSQVAADALSKQAQSEFAAGRLDRAAATAQSLRQADPDSSVANDIDRALDQCRHAWDRIERSRPHEAAEYLRRAEHLFPRCAWIAETLKHVTAAADAVGQLRAGPLSFATDVVMNPGTNPTPREVAPPVRAATGATSQLPDRFILQVDGAGAFLVVRSAAAKVGPISSPVLPDVALVADATAPAVTIERVEDDYFLRSTSPVSINDKPATSALLGSGDRIGLSPRCRFSFALPHPASTTAVLELTGARYPRADVRRVVLLDRDLVLADAVTAHVRVSGLATPVVLNLRGGLLRASVPATVNGRPLGREEGLPVGVPVAAAGASFVISRV
jgi:tetratricopeptide (TPR) repeat protein